MYFRHVPEIWQRFPQLVPGVLLIGEIHTPVQCEERINTWLDQARRRLETQSEGQMPEVAAWRRVYSQMGLKPTKYRSAAEALLRRFKREDDLPRLHPLVDLCNAASLAFALPVAAFDLKRVEEYIEVRPAAGSEQYLSFQGEIENPEPGEVIFADASDHAHARRWTFRQSRRSVVQEDTVAVLIVCEGVHEQAENDVPALVDALAGAIAALWTKPLATEILTANKPRLDFSL